MNPLRFSISIGASALLVLLQVNRCFAYDPCSSVSYSVPSWSEWRIVPGLVEENVDAYYQNKAIDECHDAMARADKLENEIKRLPDYDRKSSDLMTVYDYRRYIQKGDATNKAVYERILGNDAQRRKSLGLIPVSTPPSSYNPPGDDPNGVRLDVAPKGTTSNLSDLKNRVLKLKSPGGS